MGRYETLVSDSTNERVELADKVGNVFSFRAHDLTIVGIHKYVWHPPVTSQRFLQSSISNDVPYRFDCKSADVRNGFRGVEYDNWRSTYF